MRLLILIVAALALPASLDTLASRAAPTMPPARHAHPFESDQALRFLTPAVRPDALPAANLTKEKQ